MAEQQAPQVQIKADENELLGRFSNLVMIHHNPEEFTLHFIYVFTDGTHGKLVSSTIISPGHAKTAVARSGGKYRAIRGPVRAHSRSAFGRAASERGFRAIGCPAGERPRRRAEFCGGGHSEMC